MNRGLLVLVAAAAVGSIVAFGIAASTVAPAASAAATPAQLAVRVVTRSLNGTYGAQWDLLHPKYKAVVTRARFVQCERKAAAGVGPIEIVDVSAEGTRVIRAKLPLLGTANVSDVTLAIIYRKGKQTTSQVAEVDSLWVSNRGHWVRVYAQTDYAAYKAGKCP
jgi:hypothetical protein